MNDDELFFSHIKNVFFSFLFLHLFFSQYIYYIYIYPELRATRDRLLIKASPLCSPANIRFVDMLSICSLMPVLSRAPSTLARASLQPLPSFVLVDFLQVEARPLMQLKADADPMTSYVALPAVYIRSSPFSFLFIPSTVYRIFVIYLTGFIVLLISILFIFWLVFYVNLVFNNKTEKNRCAIL